MGWAESILGAVLIFLPILALILPPILILVVLRIRIARRIRQFPTRDLALPPVEPVAEDANPYRAVDV